MGVFFIGVLVGVVVGVLLVGIINSGREDE